MSIFTDGVSIRGLHSYRNFDLTIKERNVGLPGRSLQTVSIPYMDGYYDFSSMDGRPSYTSRTVQYSFDLLADTMQELDALKNKVAAWLLSAVEDEIQDDADPNYHFVGTCKELDWEEDDCCGVLKATFTCQPLRIHNETGEEAV